MMISGPFRWITVVFSVSTCIGGLNRRFQQANLAILYTIIYSVDVNNFFSAGTLQKTLHWASCFWTAFTACTFFLVITLFSALKYNGKMKGYGNKFPVLIEQSFLEKNYYTRQVSLCKLKRTIPNEIFLGWKSTAQ